jgi:hypothetical protein
LGIHDSAAGPHEYEKERSEQLGEKPPPLLRRIVEPVQPGKLESEHRTSRRRNVRAVVLAVDRLVHIFKATARKSLRITVTASTHIVRTG